MSVLFVLALAMVSAAPYVAGLVKPLAQPAPVPRYERAACPVEVVPDERIDCGTLIVPENRKKSGTRMIRLPVMIFRSRSAAPAPDPLLFMTGGPGNSNVAGRLSGKQNPFLDDRDYILLEQRGTRFAQPALACPETNALKGEIAAGRIRGTAARDALVRAAATCRAALVSAGADLDGYTTEATADDIEDLRQALGYRQWNLFGLSYSTRLVLTVLRKYPGGVRSVLLDSILPPEVNFDEVATANLQRSLNLVFDGCAIDRECGARYPDLRRQFADLIAAADRQPLSLGLAEADTGGRPAEIRGAEVVEAIYGALHSPQAIGLIPRIIGEAAAGRYDGLARFVKDNQGPSSYSWGLRYSVWCGEEMPFERPERIAAQLSPALGLGGVSEITATPEECRAWDVAPAPAVENEPVRSDVPALLLAGEYDPDTPPAWARQLLASMPNARYVEFRGRSHGAGFNQCGGQIETAFLRDPAGPLPIDCALKLPGADFRTSVRVP
jgi:pimeloyl-ACP methyl ester carboxylesterase